MLSVASEANKNEVYSYLKLLNDSEISFIFISFFICVPAAFFKPKNVFRRTKTLIYGLFVLSVYPNFISPTFYWAQSTFREKRFIRQESILFHPQTSGHSPENILFIIGESHRFKEFIRYFPSDKFKNLILFDDYISVHHHTTPALQSLLFRKKLSHINRIHEKSLISLFNEAGYDTYFLSYLKKEDGSQAAFSGEATHFINYSKGEKPDDIDLLAILKKLLSKNEKKLIVVKMIGVHFNFEDRYPPEYDVLRPSMQSSKIDPEAKNKETLLNTYKNAMSYSGNIIEHIVEMIENTQKSTLMSFSSDHGLCIYDNRLYILPDCKNAFHIPWFIAFNDAFAKQADTERMKTLRSRMHSPLTAEFVFETLVSLSGLTYPDADLRFDATHPEAVVQTPRKVKALSMMPVSYENL